MSKGTLLPAPPQWQPPVAVYGTAVSYERCGVRPAMHLQAPSTSALVRPRINSTSLPPTRPHPNPPPTKPRPGPTRYHDHPAGPTPTPPHLVSRASSGPPTRPYTYPTPPCRCPTWYHGHDHRHEEHRHREQHGGGEQPPPVGPLALRRRRRAARRVLSALQQRGAQLLAAGALHPLHSRDEVPRAWCGGRGGGGARVNTKYDEMCGTCAILRCRVLRCTAEVRCRGPGKH